MSTIDIREETKEEINAIVFADDYYNNKEGDEQANVIVRDYTADQKFIKIMDTWECVIINSKEHAENLIKALNKAIELGWLE